jgi:hypothetical protein
VIYLLTSLSVCALTYGLYRLAKRLLWLRRFRQKLREGPKQYALGFPMTLVRAGEKKTVRTSPEIDFDGRRLIVPSHIGGDFVILSILVNDVEFCLPGFLGGPVDARLMSSAGGETGLLAALFSEVSPAFELSIPVEANAPLDLVVRNVSGEDREFYASMIGMGGHRRAD